MHAPTVLTSATWCWTQVAVAGQDVEMQWGCCRQQQHLVLSFTEPQAPAFIAGN